MKSITVGVFSSMTKLLSIRIIGFLIMASTYSLLNCYWYYSDTDLMRHLSSS